MDRLLLKILLALLIVLAGFFFSQRKNRQNPANNYGTFSFEKTMTLPGSPESVYDALTGDISGWWDHTFSEKPYKFYIEARPGGGFYEIFDENGDGVLHATVTAARRGKLLRFVGPLGLAGNAIDLVCTYNLNAVPPDSTRLQLVVHAAGEMQPNWPEGVEKVWEHFLFERFKPFVEAGGFE